MSSEHAIPSADAIEKLLDNAGITGAYSISPLVGGANNRVYQLSVGGVQTLLKWYFSHPLDRRDRLAAEYALLRFAARHGVWQTPRPLGVHREACLGLYEFLPGHRLSPGEVREGHVKEAAEFFRSLNEHRDDADAADLPLASEACFSLAEHVEGVARRVSELAPATGNFGEELLASWTRVSKTARQAADAARLEWSAALSPNERRISPSDFGFHNAMLGPDQRLRFIDFEYSGWDDPAKTACDFFSQVQVPTPRSLAEEFLRSLLEDSAAPATLRNRIAILQPIYKIKWCCIVMNRFLPTAEARRQFSGADSAEKNHALAAARRLLRDADEELQR